MMNTPDFAGAFGYPGTLLDIGCGACIEGESIIAGGIALTGIDQDGETIREVRERLPEGNFITADAAHWLAETDQCFDAVLVRRPDLMFRPENWHAVFQRLSGVLKEGGKVIVTTPGRSEAGIASKWLRESADTVRLTEINEEEEGFLVSAENIKAVKENENDRSRLIQDLSWDDAPRMICDLRTGRCTVIKEKEERENEKRHTEKGSDKA